MNTKPTESDTHFNSLDFIKICATFAIIYHHYQEFLQVKFSHINFYFGAFPFHSMVFLFFTISGFFTVKYIPLVRKRIVSFGSYYGKRTLRLLPMTALTAMAYEFALAVFALLTGTTFGKIATDMGISGVGVISGFGMLISMAGLGSGWIWKGYMANEVTWYICVLLLCYVVFYLCCRVSEHFSVNVNCLFAVMIMAGLAIGSYGIKLPFFNEYSAQGYIPFFVGVMLGEFMEKRKYTAKGIVFGIGLIGIMSSVIYMAGMFYFTKAAFTDNYWLMFVTYPSLVVVFLSEPVKRIFKGQIWCIGGGITFDMYVWHFICLILLIAIDKGFTLNLPVGNRFFMIAFSVVVLIIGMISYYFLEKNMEHLVKYVIKKIKSTQEA